ncbi:MAG TPA: hypothetical protein VGO98_00105 [Candidatus Saccharimonadales bacterium]|nr:hypothetical protein [Candidatus Saccharimonadales bacterium]
MNSLKVRRQKPETFTPTVTPPARPLPILREWFIGWKVGNLVLDTANQRIMFFQIIWDGIIAGPYGAQAVAECNHSPWHKAPHDGCRCGFNAFSDRPRAVQYANGLSASGACIESVVTLRVGLKGRAIEGIHTVSDHRWGYRAEEQVVTDVFIPRACFSCDAAVVGFTLRRCSVHENQFAGMHYANAACSKHRGEQGTTLAQMRAHAAKDNITIRWSDE